MMIWLLSLAACSYAAQIEGPSARALPALTAVARFSLENPQSLPWATALGPLVKERALELEPLAAAIQQAGLARDLTGLASLGEPQRREVLAKLEAARAEAGPAAA